MGDSLTDIVVEDRYRIKELVLWETDLIEVMNTERWGIWLFQGRGWRLDSMEVAVRRVL